MFYDTAHDHEKLVTRPRDVTDNAMPSGTSLAVDLLARMSELTGATDLQRRASGVLDALSEPLAHHPTAFGHLLGAAEMVVHGAVAVALVGRTTDERFEALAQTVAASYVPSLVLAGGQPSAQPIALLADRGVTGGMATAYVCRHFTCELPVTEPEALAGQLERAASAHRVAS